MSFLFETLYEIFSHQKFLFFVELLAGFSKLYLLCFLLIKSFQSNRISKPLYYLLFVLFGGLLGDITWIFKLLREIWVPSLDYRIQLMFIRIGWPGHLIQFQALALLIQSLTKQNYKISLYQKFLITIDIFLILGFVYFSFVNFHNLYDRQPEFFLMQFIAFYIFVFIISSILYNIYEQLRAESLPKILKKQLLLFSKYLIFPYLVTEIIQAINISSILITQKSYAYISISFGSLFLTYAIYHAVYKVIGFRFLNLNNHVQASVVSLSFMNDMRRFLQGLNLVNSVAELGLKTQQFFKEEFGVALSQVSFYIRKDSIDHYPEQLEKYYMNQYRALFVEHKLTGETNQLYAKVLQEQRILIYDEIVFNNFYQEDVQNQELISFLEQLGADIFLPIYHQEQLTGYIIVDRNARANECFSDLERDEMAVFAPYVGHLLYLLQNRSLGSLLAQEKELRDELYSKHQEVNQYKECIRSFLKAGHRKIGIIFYRSKRFTLVNQAAQDLLDVDLNEEIGHPTSKICRQIIEQVLAYKESKAMFAHDPHGNQILLSGMLGIETNSVLITVCYPDISDMLKKQIDLLQDPSEWDYVLYLETTKSGKLINQLIPSSGPQFLNFKIALLKAALSNKAILLDAPEPDLLPTVELIHYVSLKDVLHVLTLKTTSKADDIALQIFGTHPLFADSTQPSMLEKLNGVGTLFIQNIHLLDMKLQDKLAEFIKYGYYTPTKSDQYKTSTVRIICSTQHSLQALVHEGTFSKILYHELQKTTLTMPSLLHISSEEFSALADGLVHQAASSSVLTTELNTKDKEYLLNRRPESLYDYKEKVRTMLIAKSKKQYSEEELTINPAYNVSDPSLVDARRLGKKALKNPKMMELLWRKFKSQNQIAEFLGVHRASVSRYCKKYNLAVKTPAAKQ